MREGRYPVSVSLPFPPPAGPVRRQRRRAANPGFFAACGVLPETAYRWRTAAKSEAIGRNWEKTRNKPGAVFQMVPSFGEPGTVAGGSRAA